jgi:hypothetical protein
VVVAESQDDGRKHNYTSRGRQEQDATRGGGGGEGELADMRQRCHKWQRGNQLGQTRGGCKVELPTRCKVAACQELVVLTRGREVEVAQQDAMQKPAGGNEGGGSRMDT